MHDNIKKVINKLPKDMIGTKTTATGYLFNTDRTESDLLDKERKDLFHTPIAIKLYLSQWGRPDLHLHLYH